MCRPRDFIAIAALTAFAVASSPVLAPGAAYAHSHAGSPTSTFAPAYLDSDRCNVLAQQVDAAHARPGFAGPAAAMAAQGLTLCRAGNFADGADDLERAVRLIGDAPAKPRPVIRLH